MKDLKILFVKMLNRVNLLINLSCYYVAGRLEGGDLSQYIESDPVTKKHRCLMCEFVADRPAKEFIHIVGRILFYKMK